MVHQRSIGLPSGTPWETLVAEPLPNIPSRFNIAVGCLDEQPAGALALVTSDESGVHRFTFGDVANRTARLAAGLRDGGVMRGDRIAVVLPQRWESIVAILSIMRAGAIAVPIDPEHGPDAMAHRLRDCAPRFVVVDDQTRPVVESVTDATVIHIRDGKQSVQALIAFHQPGPAVDTSAADPALMVYVGRTDGPPDGIVLPHRALLGWLPSVELALGWLPADGDRVWTPSSWMEPTGLLTAVLPALYHGVAVVGAVRPSPDPAEDTQRIRDHEVTCVVFPPDVLRALAGSGVDLSDVGLRAVAITGFVDQNLSDWVGRSLGTVVNELIVLPHVGPVFGTAAPSWTRDGDTHGRVYPGFEVGVLGSDDEPTPDATPGRLVVRSSHPAGHVGVWRRAEVPDQDGAKWVETGLLAALRPDGTVRLVGREPGTIDVSGRIAGAWEIERCLEADDVVTRAGVVASAAAPEDQSVKAYVVVRDRSDATPETAVRLATRCGERLGPHLAPKRISFVSELPLTATGDVDRAVLSAG